MANPGPSGPKSSGRRTPERDRHDHDQWPAASDVNFWAVFESAPDAYLLLAPDPPRFTMVAANEARLRATMTRREDVIGRPLFEVFPDDPSDPDATGVRNLQASLQEVLRTGKPHRMALQKFDIRTPDGEFEERYWDPLNSPVFDERGKLIYIVHRVEDVTERVRTDLRLRRETAARAEEARARKEIETILESITDAFYAVDREWRFTYVNRRAEEILRRPREELVGRILWEEFPEAVGTTLDREYHRSMAEQTTAAFETFYAPLDICVEVRAYPTPELLSVYLRDITERKRAEQALHESEERYRLLADLIPQYIWTTDANGYHGYFSRRWYDLTGATLEETEGDGWMQFLHPDDRERTIARWQHSLGTGEPYSIEYRFRGVDGEYRWFWGQAMPQRDDAGVIVGWFGTLTDISERKRLDEEREHLLSRDREAREKVTTILESITDAFFAVDREWRFTYVNHEAERLLQRPRRELLGRSLWDEFPEAVGTASDHDYRRAMTEQVTVAFEQDYPPLGIWVDVRAYPSADGLSVFFRDVTDRKRAEERLRESEGRFRALAENANAAIFVIDKESSIEFANPAAERIFGYTVKELLGQSIDMLMPTDQRPRHHAGVRRYLETGRRNIRWEGVELPGLTKDGRVIPLEISMGEFVREGQHYFTGIARDITERKQAEEALRESEERFRTLGNSIPQLAWMADASGWIFWYNERWHEYTGTTLEEMEGWGWRKVHHPAHVDRVVQRIRHSFETGEPWEDTFPLRSKTGEYRWFLSRALPIRDPHGKVVRWFGTNTDITNEMEAAGERERLLEGERQLRAEAERQHQELERVTESRARLVRGFSHDVKNPLGAADGFLQLLEDGIIDPLSGKQKESVGRARRSVGAALKLIENLTELARAEAGKIEIECEPVDVGEVAREMADEYRAKAEAHGLTMRVELPGESPVIESDSARVRQVLGNLLSNATKYTPKGGITVRLALREDGRTPHPGRWVAVDVSDTGPGISAEEQRHLFEEFRRLETAGETTGAGIGLTISQSLARALGGDITVESEVGRGSTFTLWLPLA